MRCSSANNVHVYSTSQGGWGSKLVGAVGNGRIGNEANGALVE